MAFILRSSKYVNDFLGLARRASLIFRRKRVLLLDYASFFRFNELWSRNAATAAPKPVLAFPFNTDKSITHLHNNLKASMVDLYNVQLTLNSLKDSGVMSPSQLILLLKCCGSAAFKNSEDHRVKVAKSIWETAKELGTELDIAHYNTLLSVFVENNFKFAPEKILSEIEKAGLEPNRVTYRRLLKAFCQQGNIQGASQMLEQIKQKKFPINEYDFCSLIQGHCEAGELDEAAKIFNVMRDRGIQPSLEPYIYLLCGYAKYGKIDKLEELLDEISKQQLQMTDAYLLNIVYTLIVNNRAEHIDSILARMKKSNDYEKTLMKVVHRILHKNKDEEAMKLFGILAKMGYVDEYIRDQAHSIIEHFVFNRTPSEVINICQRMQDEGWTKVAFSHGLKKAVLRKELEYCSSLLFGLKKNGFPIRSHYFWPLIVRYSEEGNPGILSVLKVMKEMHVTVCYSTLKTMVKEYYKFSKDWATDLDHFTKYGARESQICLILLNEALAKGHIKNAEFIASSYGIFRPQKQTINLLVRCFAKSCPQEEDSFLNILYYLAHDVTIYDSRSSQEASDGEEDTELTGLGTFFHEAFNTLMNNCSQDVFLSVLQNASKKKLTLPSQTADLIRQNFSTSDVDVLLKEFTDLGHFELDQELLKKKSENATIIPKSLDPSGILHYASKNDMKAEELWEELGSRASLEDHLAMLTMYVRMKLYDKAFKVIDRMNEFSGRFDEGNHGNKKFRISLHLLRNSGDVEKVIKAYQTGVKLGLIDEDHVIPVIRTILNCYDINVALNQYGEFFEKVRNLGSFLEIMEHVLSGQNADAVKKLTEIFVKATNENVAFTALFTAYLANGQKAEARNVLETQSFRFQDSIFLWWFKNEFENSQKTFEDVMEIVKELGPQDRTRIYEFLLSKYRKEKDDEKIKMLWLQCQEDNITDPFFLEHLRHCVRGIEKKDGSEADLMQYKQSSNALWNEEKELKKIQDLLKVNKYTPETLDKLMSGKLPERIARKMLQVLAGEGKSSELILIINKYQFGRFLPEISAKMLENNKVKEFMEFVNAQASMKRYSGVYNCFASQQERILSRIQSDEEFFQELKELSLRCYDEGKYEALLVLLIKLCVQLPEKLSEAEELLAKEDSRIVSHFRNYALSNMLLSSTEEVDFYKNVLASEKVKGVFSEALDHFYDRVINYYNENGDVEKALSYLEKAKLDGVEEKLNKEVVYSLKKNLEERGTTFPYPQLVTEAARTGDRLN